MPDRRDHRPTGLELAALSSALGAAAGLALEHRHLRRIARDAELAALSRRSDGRPIRVRSADGTSLHAEVFGPDGGPTLVLAHGWTEQLSYWTTVIGELVARGLRLVAYDLRGHGRSGRAAGGVARLTVPTLVVTGDCDKLTPPSHSHRIAETLPDLARLIELPDTGHMSPLERPAELSAALGTLVDGLAQSRACPSPET